MTTMPLGETPQPVEPPTPVSPEPVVVPQPTEAPTPVAPEPVVVPQPAEPVTPLQPAGAATVSI